MRLTEFKVIIQRITATKTSDPTEYMKIEKTRDRLITENEIELHIRQKSEIKQKELLTLQESMQGNELI